MDELPRYDARGAGAHKKKSSKPNIHISSGLQRSGGFAFFGRYITVQGQIRFALLSFAVLSLVSIMYTIYKLPAMTGHISDTNIGLRSEQQKEGAVLGDESSPRSQVCASGPDGDVLNQIKLWKHPESQSTKKDEPKILCLVMTTQPKHSSCQAIKQTWGTGCNRLLFISNQSDASLPAIKTGQAVPDSYANLYQKVIWAFNYGKEQYFDDVDWVMKADDDSHVIMENLRAYLLSPEMQRDSERPLYIGRRLNNGILAESYNSGGSAYLLNKRAWKALVAELREGGKCDLKKKWKFGNYPEDAIVGWCLHRLGIYTRDTRDEMMKERFHFFAPEMQATTLTKPEDWWSTFVKPWGIFYSTGLESISTSTISFHYVDYPEYHRRIYNHLQYCNH